MDDMTFIYFADDSQKSLPYLNLQLAFIQNETKHSLIRVTSPELAALLKLDHGKFYCVYKPSFANYNFESRLVTESFPEDEEPQFDTVRKYPNVADQLLNRKYMDEFQLDETYIRGEDFQAAFE